MDKMLVLKVQGLEAFDALGVDFFCGGEFDDRHGSADFILLHVKVF